MKTNDLFFNKRKNKKAHQNANSPEQLCLIWIPNQNQIPNAINQFTKNYFIFMYFLLEYFQGIRL